MQTLTFTQKLLRQRKFLSSLLPLFALFAGLGLTSATQAQTINTSSFLVDPNATGTSTTYGGKGGVAPLFNGAAFGTFDINTGQLLLNGGQITTTDGDDGVDNLKFTTAFLQYTIYKSGTTTPTSYANSITLTRTSGPDATGNSTFTLTNAQVNLIRDAVVAANGGGVTPGTTYNIKARFEADYTATLISNGSADPNNDGAIYEARNAGGSGYIASFKVTGTIPPPSGATISNQMVIVDQGNGSVTYSAAGFNGPTLADQKPGSTTAPKFDINTGQLILKGGSLTTTETGGAVVNGAFLDYIVYAPNYSTTLSTGTLQLTQGTVTGNTRNFSLTTGTTNLISLATAQADGYIVSITYHITYQANGAGAPSRVNDNGPTGSGYNGKFDVVGNLAPAPTVAANNIDIAADGGSNSRYFFPSSTNNPQFPGANLVSTTNANGVAGSFDVNSGQLRLINTTVTTTEAGPNSITSVVLYYRTRLSGTAGGAYQPITLTQSGSTAGGVRTFVIDPASTLNTNAQPNLIATPAVTAAGTYNVDIYYQANGFNSASGSTFTLLYPPTGYFSASFTVSGSPIATTIWTGARNDNWFDDANWSNGKPTATTNALIRDLGAGNAVPYPNINSDTRVTTAGGALLYDNTGSGPAMCRTFTMGGTSQASRSIARLVIGQLKVFGDFNNQYDSFIQREGTIMEFAGSPTSPQNPQNVYYNAPCQTISGGSFVRVDISGGGKKLVTGIMNISEGMNFLTPGSGITNPYTASNADAGILATDITTPTVSLVTLSDRALVNGNNGAQLTGETDNSFLYGFVRTTRLAVLVGETRTYGNMGMTLTFTGTNAPGNVDVTRNTVESYTPLNGKFSIRRIFGVRPSDPATTTGGLVANMIFHYRDSETQRLNGVDPLTGGRSTIVPGTSSIAEAQLTIFVSSNSGNTFQLVGRDGPVDEVNNNVTITGVRTFATFTLGDKDNPLPVRLTAFDAKRIGNDALVTWQTASEVNSKGYDVQVSTNGTEFRTLSSVPSASPNSIKTTSYSYTDTEANKTGKRYYRLRQVDIDGKETFFAPIVVSFDGKAATTTLVAYPNPFNSNDELHIAAQSPSTGKGQLLMTDMTGRTITKQTVEMTSGLTDVTVTGISDLKAGLYLVKITLPSGEVKNLKVQKQ